MAIEHKLQRCPEDDPNRCQATGKFGQCPYLAVANSKYCHRHGGNKANNVAFAGSQYRLEVWQQRVNEFSQSETVKSLKDEIGILRLLIETIMVRCTDQTSLIIQSSKIADLITKLEKLTTSCNRLDASMGMLLDKTSALAFASQIVNIIIKYVDDPVVHDEISNEIIDILASLTG